MLTCLCKRNVADNASTHFRSPVLESFSHLHVVDYQQSVLQEYKRDMCLNMTMSGVVDGCGIDGSQQRAGMHTIPGQSSNLHHTPT